MSYADIMEVSINSDNKLWYLQNNSAIYTDKEVKVGYISEKELDKFHTENTGIIPIVMEAHYYKDKLYGYLYTFTNNKEEYHYIRNQFEKLLENVEL